MQSTRPRPTTPTGGHGAVGGAVLATEPAPTNILILASQTETRREAGAQMPRHDLASYFGYSVYEESGNYVIRKASRASEFGQSYATGKKYH